MRHRILTRKRRATQRGGARRVVGQEAPEITSGETLKRHCDAFFLSAHGDADLEQFMVVPEKTFILFQGASGFFAQVGQNPSLPHILSHRPDSPESEYWSALYRSFFSPAHAPFAHGRYEGAYIYMPGDILPDMNLTFLSGTQPVWAKGLYSLPLQHSERFTLPSAEYTIVPYLLKLDIQGKLSVDGKPSIEFLTKAGVYGKEGWDEMKADFAAHGPTEKFFHDWETGVTDWFAFPERIGELLLDAHLYDQPDNVLTKEGLAIPHTATVQLSGLLEQLKTENYRFLILNSCRAPTTLPAEAAAELVYGHTAPPRELNPVTFNRARVVARRASLSARCAPKEDPSMNLKVLRALFQNVLGFSYQPPETAFLNTLGKFFSLSIKFQERAFTVCVGYMPSVPVLTLAALANKAVLPYEVAGVSAEAKAVFQALYAQTRKVLGTFLKGVHADSAPAERALRSIGEELLHQTRGSASLPVSESEREAAQEGLCLLMRPEPAAEEEEPWPEEDTQRYRQLWAELHEFNIAEKEYTRALTAATKEYAIQRMRNQQTRALLVGIPLLKRVGSQKGETVQEIKGDISRMEKQMAAIEIPLMVGNASKEQAATAIQSVWRGRTARRGLPERRRRAAIEKNQNAILKWKRNTMRGKPTNSDRTMNYLARRRLQTRLEKFAEDKALANEQKQQKNAVIEKLRTILRARPLAAATA